MNVLADQLSRGEIAPGEWEIQDEDFAWINEKVPGLEVDIMATPFNNKLECFTSPFNHPRAFAEDAFMVDWNQWSKIYIFPPPGLVDRVVQELEKFHGLAGELLMTTHYDSLVPSLFNSL